MARPHFVKIQILQQLADGQEGPVIAELVGLAYHACSFDATEPISDSGIKGFKYEPIPDGSLEGRVAALTKEGWYWLEKGGR